MPASPALVTTAIAAGSRITAGKIRMKSIASFISRPSIFLPKYSGVRPTISPAMNTDSTAITSIP